MHWVDWSIVFGLVAFLIAVVLSTNRLSRSVADFLAAGRCAGRYTICISEGIAAVGAISLVGLFEVHYQAGFTAVWWSMMMAPVTAIISLSGWVIYRYRQTRALTLGQFFEIRYSRRFRIFAGILCFASGVINFGIFPAVGARFFIYYCGMPATVLVLGVGVSTFALLMFVLLAVALFFTFVGGQVAVILTDFVQGILCNLAFVAILVFVLWKVGWSQITEALLSAPAQASLLHPFHTGEARDFNVWFFIIGAFGYFYTYLSWQGSQGYNASARNPHEARMAKILGTWKVITQTSLIVMLPICAYTLMHHEAFVAESTVVDGVLATIDNPQIQKQMVVPVALSRLFPLGLMGVFCAVVLAAFIGNHDTYLHSWGSIFIQDVVMPLRGKPLTPKQHIRLLRWSIFGVAVFIYMFSLLFRQTEYIYMFFAITGAIFAGGSGAVIIGGLYWKRGNTRAAWAAMITGSVLAVAGIVVRQVDPEFPLNGQWLWLVAMIASSVVYVATSLLVRSGDFDMDRMLHRGTYAVKDDMTMVSVQSARGLNSLLGISREFTLGDKVIYYATIGWTVLWGAVFILGTAYNLVADVPVSAWARYWQFYVVLSLVLGVVTTAWFTVGGLLDVKQLYTDLRSKVRNDADDGMVRNLPDRDLPILRTELDSLDGGVGVPGESA
jgi:SSS family solute:Na+ symporter